MYYKYKKVWCNNKPGLYVAPFKDTHKILVYFDGCWMEHFVFESSLKDRKVNISKYIFKERMKTLQYERIV